MKTTFKSSKYYAVNIRRGVIYAAACNSAKEIKNLNHKDIIPVTGKDLMAATTFSGYSVEEGSYSNAE